LIRGFDPVEDAIAAVAPGVSHAISTPINKRD